MGCLGVHFAISAEGAEQLLAANDDAELVAIVDEIEDEWELVHETDKAWDALHRCLSNGTLHSGEGDAPLNRVLFGEKSDDDWEYTKSNFDGLPAFFAQAATADKYVIFTVSQ